MPKALKENILWRQHLRQLAIDDEAFRHDLIAACSASFLYWCNAFVWTYRQKEVIADGSERPIIGDRAHAPFVTWLIEDEVAEKLIKAATEGGDINLEKSREMGATWLTLAVADHFLLFRKSVNIGLVSRKEQLVDWKGEMDSLFEKVRYIHKMLPPWMVPRISDRYMHLANTDYGSTISGESTNTDVGRGGRKTFYIVDEAAAIRNGEEIEKSLSNNSACQIWISTPHGPMTTFHKRIVEGRGKRIQMPWWRHPEKARGAHQILDPTGKVRWTSPWYEKLPERFSRKTIAQEVDMDHGSSGDMFFDFTELERHRRDHEVEPGPAGDLVPIESMTAEDMEDAVRQMDHKRFRFIPGHKRCPWHFWFELIDGRPPQYYTYVMGVDISNGAGASNSVITVLARETMHVVAKYWDAYTPPEELAVLAQIAGVWFGGIYPPAFICWENNGPGGIFGRKVVKASYPSFYRQRQIKRTRDKRTPRWGWNSNRDSKDILLGLYRDALSRDAIINPCKESLDEASEYIYLGREIIPARLQEETGGGRLLHGDHVIADALAHLASMELPAQRQMPIAAPPHTFAARREAHRRKTRRELEWAG